MSGASEPAAPRRRGRAVLDLAMALVGLVVLAAMVTVPLRPGEQAAFAVITALMFMIGNRFAGRGATMFLIALSLAVSARYLFWRLSDTLRFGGWTELCLGGGLMLAELYAAGVLLFGYVQTAWPRGRPLCPLPPDPDDWPSVDVYIPTVNEPLRLVRNTVLAALSMDYPPEKLRVFLLDDGRREAFRLFAEEVGCEYLTRKDNRHAKAGNLNAALARTDGEMVAVFDCDHVPTRSFLQLTLGWLVAEPGMAFVQTPQHFHSPDPFQRNLAAGGRVPAESNLFHGPAQDGNDFWNAAFFCGTGAVLRRAALEGIGGFAVETVTEDAHTALKLHRAGWRSAYVRLPLAAGLATERLSRHIRQRARWARGMLQILRLDNPLFGRGLSLGQRVCYLQAAGHFLFALPRIVFLTAPLAFLLFGQNVIAASPLAITAYAAPHLFHAIATHSRLNRNWRHSFWGEIYETVLALFLVRVTVATLLWPRRGRFDVTPKGDAPEEGSFDVGAVWPNLLLAMVLVLGIGRAMFGMAEGRADAASFDALVMNAAWAGVSLLIVLAALAAGREAGQTESRSRIPAAIPCAIHLPFGQIVVGATVGLSESGAIARIPRPDDLAVLGDVLMEVTVGGDVLLMPARLASWRGDAVELMWQPGSAQDEADIVRVVFGRADAWAGWADYPNDRPLVSLWHVLVSIGGLFRSREPAPVAEPPADGAAGDNAPMSAPARVGAVTAAALLLVLFGGVAADSQSPKSGVAVRIFQHGEPPIPAGRQRPAAPLSNIQTAPVAPVAEAPLAAPSGGATTTGAAGAGATGATDAAAATTDAAGKEAAARDATREVVYTLAQLGASGALRLTGVSDQQGVDLVPRPDEVVRSARLALTGAMSPSLLPDGSNISVTLNGHAVGVVQARRDQPIFAVEMPVAPELFVADNRLEFHFAGRVSPDCDDRLSPDLWGNVADTSTLTLTLERLAPQRDLARLPRPFLAETQTERLALPFVLPADAGDDALRAAGIVASWFGVLAGDRVAGFPVASEPPARGNAVVIAIGASAPGLPDLPRIDGPTIAMLANPRDPLGSLLVIAGRTGAELVDAATSVAIGTHLAGARSTLVASPDVAAREPYDAPNWIPASRPVRLGELIDAADLRTEGPVGVLNVPFRAAPDLTTWRDRPFEVSLLYRAPPASMLDPDASRLDVAVNGRPLDTRKLASRPSLAAGLLSRLLPQAAAATRAEAARVPMPVAALRGANELQVAVQAIPPRRAACATLPRDLRLSIDPDSTIDLSGGYRFARLPDLGFFAGSGFPFTRMADLADTVVVLPEHPADAEIAAFLGVLGRFGAQTGAPSLRVAVARPDELGAMTRRDVLMLGTPSDLGAAGDLLRLAPVTLADGRIALRDAARPGWLARLFDGRLAEARDHAAAAIGGGRIALLAGGQNPREPGGSVVAMLAAAPAGLDELVTAPRDDSRGGAIQGDLAVLTGGQVASFRIGASYTVGHLPPWVWPSWYLRDRLGALLVLLVLGCALLGRACYWTLRRRADWQP